MITEYGQLTYCTNIHGGEAWDEHFESLKTHFPVIKQAVSPSQPMGIGLRLADRASRTLTEPTRLAEFMAWLGDVGGYVFTMNGFPFGAFHGTVVKEHVHTPDWTTTARLHYTKRLFAILAELLPDGMDGGISTSPLGYRYQYADDGATRQGMRQQATRHIVEVAAYLYQIRQEQGKDLHLDIEPEPDGVLETGEEFIAWYVNELVPEGMQLLSNQLGITRAEAEQAIKHHIRLCYDVCHFALGYEDHHVVVEALAQQGIQIGKFQISAAIKAAMPADKRARKVLGDAFMAFDEPTYLHQVIAKHSDGLLVRFRDLPEAQTGLFEEQVTEWRSHFHVPIFLEDLGTLKSTQSDILQVLDIHKHSRRSNHLEVETYTWGVLPEQVQRPIAESISRELNWVLHQFIDHH